MSRSVLVYDGSDRAFRAAARLLARRSPDLTPVPWRADRVQSFLEAQFGDRPFAFVAVDLDSGVVRAGRATVEWLARDQGLPGPLAALAGRLYPHVADPVGRLLHGRPPADLDGVFEVRDDARPHLESLRRHRGLPACVD